VEFRKAVEKEIRFPRDGGKGSNIVMKEQTINNNGLRGKLLAPHC